MRFFLHIGAHKTASTHLQRRLSRAATAFGDGQALVLGPRELRPGTAFDSIFTPGWDDQPQRRALWRARLAEAEASGCTRLVLSEENLIGTMIPGVLTGPGDILYPEAAPRLARLVAMLDRRPATVALAVREPSSFLTSAFGMWLEMGEGVLFEQFAGRVDPARLSWADLARRVLDATGTPRLLVWRFEDYHRLRNRVLAQLIGPKRAAVAGHLRPQLVGWSAAAYSRLLEDVLASDGTEDLGALARAARKTAPRMPGEPPMQVIPEGVRARSAAAYAQDWQALRALPGVEALG